jgi:predicted PurR-regulated permease PerM
MLPPDQAARVKGVLGEVTKVISSSLVGNLAISLIAGTVVGVTAWLIGAPRPGRAGGDRRRLRSGSADPLIGK